MTQNVDLTIRERFVADMLAERCRDEPDRAVPFRRRWEASACALDASPTSCNRPLESAWNSWTVPAGRGRSPNGVPRPRLIVYHTSTGTRLGSAGDCAPGAYDAAIECVGRPELLQACQTAVRPLGRIVISGACGEAMPIEPVTALLKELTIAFSVCYRPDEFREVIAAFSRGDVDPNPMMGPQLDLDRIAEAFDLVRNAAAHGRVFVGPRSQRSA